MIKTLVIDGNNLLKIGVCGVKDFYNNGEHVGGIWMKETTIKLWFVGIAKVIQHNEDYFTPIINLTEDKQTPKNK